MKHLDKYYPVYGFVVVMLTLISMECLENIQKERPDTTQSAVKRRETCLRLSSKHNTNGIWVTNIQVIFYEHP